MKTEWQDLRSCTTKTWHTSNIHGHLSLPFFLSLSLSLPPHVPSHREERIKHEVRESEKVSVSLSFLVKYSFRSLKVRATYAALSSSKSEREEVLPNEYLSICYVLCMYELI